MNSHDVIDLVVKALSGLGLIITSVLAVSKYRSDADADFRKPLWVKQLDLYFEASTIVSTIANSAHHEERRVEAEKQFWILYWGPLALIEDEDVAAAMVAFGKGLSRRGVAEVDRNEELKEKALLLAKACRVSIGSSWNVRLDHISVRGEGDE